MIIIHTVLEQVFIWVTTFGIQVLVFPMDGGILIIPDILTGITVMDTHTDMVMDTHTEDMAVTGVVTATATWMAITAETDTTTIATITIQHTMATVIQA